MTDRSEVRNVFVLGLDEHTEAVLRQLPDAERYRFHPLLTIEELQYGDPDPPEGVDYPMWVKPVKSFSADLASGWRTARSSRAHWRSSGTASGGSVSRSRLSWRRWTCLPSSGRSVAELFEHVDGAANHQAMLRLALGEAPDLPCARPRSPTRCRCARSTNRRARHRSR